jgi:adenylate cyclase
MVTLEITLVTAAVALTAASSGVVALQTPLVLTYFVLVGLTVLRLDPAVAAFAGLLAAAQYVGLAVATVNGMSPDTEVAADQLVPLYYFVRAAVMVLMGVAAAFVAWELRRRITDTWTQMMERERIRRSFGEHADPTVVDVILRAGGVVAGERRRVCVMFLDLRGYSSFADGRDPKEVVDFLNRFFGICIPVVTGAGGVVHQLLGDGFMAIFGAPVRHGDDERRAAECATVIVESIADAVERGDLPSVEVGVGLHAGEVVAGSVGTTSHREYKVTGDVVNMASRIEALTKDLGTPILASAEVWHTGRSPALSATFAGATTLRGHAEPVELFAIERA